jgi:hypothetical protein
MKFRDGRIIWIQSPRQWEQYYKENDDILLLQFASRLVITYLYINYLTFYSITKNIGLSYRLGALSGKFDLDIHSFCEISLWRSI